MFMNTDSGWFFWLHLAKINLYTCENDSEEILTLESRSNYVTTVCDHAKESRPVFAGQVVRLHQSLEDPLRCHGSRWTSSAFGRYEIKSGGAAPRPWNGNGSLLLASSPFDTLQNRCAESERYSLPSSQS